jgi:hypothetical protein
MMAAPSERRRPPKVDKVDRRFVVDKKKAGGDTGLFPFWRLAGGYLAGYSASTRVS